MPSDTVSTNASPEAAYPASVHVIEAPETISGKELSTKEREYYGRTFLDVEATRIANLPDSFPYRTANELIEHAKYMYMRLFVSLDFSVLASNFQFQGPVVGPIPRDEFIQAWETFDLLNAFPDADGALHDLRVDPYMPTRVWMTSQFLSLIHI